MKIIYLILFSILSVAMYSQTERDLLRELAIQNKTNFADLFQLEGNYNNININYSNQDIQEVLQIGSFNNYEHYSSSTNFSSNLQIIQEGNNNSLLIFGENSIMKDAKIIQKSNLRSVIIKNYGK